ncbi:lipid-A-disaccharide synthase [Cyclobacterium jeungdonense]|uniref:Lipid-A-disaccharide synthase n=1 Tax=Cyclobacterium jeungdonense TaxID=708087 RepID=A0ABT8C607_9BACT|nr:lipid-A-disaccharide synthase [Cyclobacterium jeungdonense]MDN3688223.1 lipid-A-disaccharide synthase [Cyclobacterium jeungdonense]
MNYYIIAGERSGDLHASNLLHCLKQVDSKAEFRGMGGDYMEGEGCILVAHYREMALMGFLEVLLHFRRVVKYLDKIKADLLKHRPDALILVDFGGFNMKMAAFASKNGIPVHYYIAPKVWAWNQNRAFKLKKYVDHLYCILPFEPEFFKRFDWQVAYVGNPLLDEKRKFKPDPDFLQKHQIHAEKLVALLPGSRKQEIRQMLQTMIALKSEFKEVDWVVAGVKNLPGEVYDEAKAAGLKVVFDQTYDVLYHARAAIVTSGTATLETALFGVPQVVVYKTSGITYAIAKRLVRVPFASLVNLITGKEVVKELIQTDYSPATVKRELEVLLPDGLKRQAQLEGYGSVMEKIGTKKASRETASLIYGSLLGPQKIN